MSKKLAEFLKGAYVTRTSGYLDVTAKAELFREISALTGGVFSKSHNPGNVLTTLRMVIPYKKWEIRLTESDTRPLKIQVGFESLLDYELILSVEDSIDKILKKLGKREIEIGDGAFDSHYLIHGNDPTLTVKLLNESIRQLILKQGLYNLSYLTDKKSKKSELITVVSRTLDEKEAYLDLVSVHQALIDRLLELGIIADRN